MPRIVPLQLLKCLKVLLDDNGGILSESEVRRIAGLMTKYSKKLVSKCIYVQILKCTKTELLGEFMGAGGWTLVHMWLNDAIRAMNWPLVQEILELLLLCPVDVDRLKSNSAPKLVRGLCKDGGIEGVRILAKRLVEQWLKVVTADSSVAVSNATVNTTTNAMPPQATTYETPAATETAAPPIVAAATTAKTITTQSRPPIVAPQLVQKDSIDSETSEHEEDEEQDPLADVPNDVPIAPSYVPTPAQKKASEAGLVYKIVVKDGQQVLTKVDAPHQQQQTTTAAMSSPTKRSQPQATEATPEKEEEEGKDSDEAEVEADEEDVQAEEEEEAEEEDDEEEQDRESQSQPKAEPQQKSQTKLQPQTQPKPQPHTKPLQQPQDVRKTNKSIEVKTQSAIVVEKEPVSITENSKKNAAAAVIQSSVEQKSTTKSLTEPTSNKKGKDSEKIVAEDVKVKDSKDKTESKENKIERKSSKDSKDGKEKEREKDKDKERKSDKDKERKSSASSSSHKSSSQKSSSKSSSSSSSGKSKSTSSSSSEKRSSSEKPHRNSSDKEKERSSSSSSSKDKERNNTSSSSSKSSKSSSSKSVSSSSSNKESSSKERPRDKEREKSSSSSSSSLSRKEKDNLQAEKDKETLANMTKQPSIDKLGKIPRKPKPEADPEESNSASKPPVTSITIPSKKTSMSIEIRRDSEKTKTVKTYKSQFRSHGLTEEAPPPPSRKGLKKPSSAATPGTSIPLSLPSSLKRASPPPIRDSPTEKKAKMDINNVSSVGTEKPGAIKLIAPKKIAHLVETNIFSDALSAATGPKKTAKRKRPVTPKDGASPPTSPETPKVAPLKFYQDTLDESHKEEEKESSAEQKSESTEGSSKDKDEASDKDNAIEDDDDIPLKKVKEDIEQQVLKEKKASSAAASVIQISDNEEEQQAAKSTDGKTSPTVVMETEPELPAEPKKPGPGCGPNGPPGVLSLHRRKGPKKKLSWRPQEHLEQIRYFELDETERVNVTKTFMDMKNMERFSERDAINMSRRGFNHEDNMEPQTPWKTLLLIDGVPPHPDGNQSKERKVQADREQTTLRALYFSHSMIPDSPTEAEFEPHYAHDIPVIPLDDITGNPDAVNDFTSMPWPDPKSSPKHGDNTQSGGANDIFNSGNFNPFVNPFMAQGGAGIPLSQQQPQQQQQPPPQQQLPPPAAMQMGAPPAMWQGPNGRMPGGPMGGPGNHFNGPMPSSPDMGSMGPGGPMGPPHPNFMGGRNQFPQSGPPPNQYGPGGPQFGPPPGFNGPPNFGPMVPGPMMNGMGPGPGPHMGNIGGGPMMNGPGPQGQHGRGNNNNRGGNWRSGGSNYSDNNNGGGGGGGGGGNWRPPGPGANRSDWTSGNSNPNTGVCKSYMRGHCRLGKSCKYIHPKKKRL